MALNGVSIGHYDVMAPGSRAADGLLRNIQIQKLTHRAILGNIDKDSAQAVRDNKGLAL